MTSQKYLTFSLVKTVYIIKRRFNIKKLTYFNIECMVNEFLLLHALEADNKYVSQKMQRKFSLKYFLKKTPKI